MSAKNDSTSWLSRLFGGSSSAASSSSTAEEPKTMVSPILKKRVDDAKSLIKSISPATNGTTRIKSIRTLSPPSSIIQRVDKRKIHENGNPPGMEDIFQATPKRHCPTGNLSWIEEPIRISVPERLDMTWAGDQRVDASPASSVRSLRSRLSGAASTASSGLSSKTRAILQQLEKVHTPAKEIRRLPVMRTATVTSERWNTASAALTSSFSSSADPPLRKQRTAVPTRLQLLSTNLGFNKTPYWKDIYRPTMKERDEAVKRKETNGNGPIRDLDLELNGSHLHPIFEIPTTRSPQKKATEVERHHKASMVKGPDGKSRNVFNTRELDDEEEVNALPLPEPVKMPMTTAPKQGFLGELTFQFEKPMERVKATNNGKMNKSFELQDSSDDSDTSEAEITSSGESSPASTPVPEEPIASPEPTFAFSQPTKPKEPEATPKSTPSAVPFIQTAAPSQAKSKWSCGDCFVENDDSLKTCACCGAAREGGGSSQPAATATLKPTTFAPIATGSFSFGFGAAKSAEDKPAEPKPAEPKPVEKAVEKPLMTASSSSPNLFGQSSLKPAEPSTTAPPNPTFGAKTTEQWTCQACFCQSTGTSCVVCQTPKEGAAQPAAKEGKTLVSNLSTFASTAPSTAVYSFGQSATAEKPTEKAPEAAKPLFGLTPSTSTPVFSQTKSDAPVIPLGTPAVPAATTAPVAQEAPKSLFGTSAPLFPAKAAEKAPLFGATEPAKTSLFPGPATATSSTDETPKPLFGAPSAEPVKLTFGAPATAAPAAPATFPKLDFGVSSAATEAPKPLFGETTTATLEAPKLTFGGVATAPLKLFGTTTVPPAVEPPKLPIFGGSSTTEAPKTAQLTFGAPAATNPLLFGAPTTTEAPKLSFGAPAAAGGLFGNLGSIPPSTVSSKPLIPTIPPFGSITPAIPAFGSTATPSFGSTTSAFGAASSDAPATKKPMFGNFSAGDQKPPAFGQSSSSTNLFGQSNSPAAATGFNFGNPTNSFSLGATPAPPSMTTSSSAGNLFSTTTAPTDFNFGTTQNTAGGSQPYVFGSNPPPASTSLFGSSGPFGSSSSSSGLTQGARKIAHARRRNAGRK